jgi:enoyl-CoA hydratase
MELAGVVAGRAPLAVAASRRIMHESRDWPRAEAYARQRPLLAPLLASADAEEGTAAFVENRPPRWTGR